MITVCLLGGGNVATHLFNAFSKSKEVTVVQWYNRNLKHLSKYKSLANITDNLADLISADVYFLAVSDTAIKPLSSHLPFENKLVVHTSGSVNIHDLDKKNERGVFYPLQSFSKTSPIDFANVPICIETLRSNDYQLLKKIAISLGSPYRKVNSEQRSTLHLAAVFVNNFTNQLYRVAHEITESEGAEFDMLKPLIIETAKKIEHISPLMAQTGPALRNDILTIKKHESLITNNHFKDIYKLLTKSIQLTHGIKKL